MVQLDELVLIEFVELSPVAQLVPLLLSYEQ
jgi:hypothetical protein